MKLKCVKSLLLGSFFFSSLNSCFAHGEKNKNVSFEKSTTENKTVVAEKNKKITEKEVVALSRFGEPTFDHLKLVNKDAPKGGTLKLSTVGTFDTVNDKIVKGIFSQGVPLTLESLMMRSPAEPFAFYALVAEKMVVASDNSYVVFYINPKAKFQNGDFVTTEDIKFSMETLRDKGLPRYKKFFGAIEKVEILSDKSIKFYLKPTDKGNYDPEMPLILGLHLCVLSKKQLESFDFQNSGLTPLIGTGPYIFSKIEQGHRVVLKRDEQYWGKDLENSKGLYNFDTIQIEYFKNAQANFQAFLAKEFDVFFETDPKQWANGYNVPAVQKNEIVKEDLHHERAVAVKTVIFNMRKPKFQNLELRRALVMAFDAKSLIKRVLDDSLEVPCSLFANTKLAHTGPCSFDEKEILEKYKSKIEPRMYDRMMKDSFKPAHLLNEGDVRKNIEEALHILDAAGYKLKDGKRLDLDGSPLDLSIMVKDERLEKIALALKESLKFLGIDLTIRKLDANQYENKVTEFDFDMIIHTWMNSLSPGAEQSYYFGSKFADIKGSSNYIGLKDEVAENLANELFKVTTYEDLKTKIHSLDRYVMHLCLQIPLMFDNTLRFAYWKDSLAIPLVDTKYDVNVMTRGWDPKKDGSYRIEKEESREPSKGFFASIFNFLKTLF